MSAPAEQGRAARRNRDIRALGGAALAVGMIGLTFAAVPFYSRVLPRDRLRRRAATCRRRPRRPQGERTLRVAFDTNVAPGLNWRFEPETESINIRAGKTATVYLPRGESQ